ncbi:hypothetical protein LL254_00430 [Marinobacter nauticus]|uniref:helix-turn-helix domain-containing protein n=1 Tax=Marinobacter nauticus TaxID=2743 RepID=UPI001D18E887|nr:hypothetical protein [Marinobacter nauticus]MCC4269172.1 hypothetical protein [Marinobacter nauticus]
MSLAAQDLSLAEMLNELMNTGLTQGQIAELVGCSQPTICRALQGSDPGWNRGNKIEALYVERVKTSAAAA